MCDVVFVLSGKVCGVSVSVKCVKEDVRKCVGK